MKPIKVAIETLDGGPYTVAVRADTESSFGVRTVLNAEYADAMLLVVPEPMDGWNGDVLPPVRLSELKRALEPFGVTVVTPSSLSETLENGEQAPTVNALKELRKLFREFKSNPLHDVEFRGKEPADPAKRELRRRARAHKDGFYEDLAAFIAEHPALTYKDYWNADHRPYERQWPEYRRAVKRAKELKGDDNDALHAPMGVR